MTIIPTADEFYETMSETYREKAGFKPEAASDIGIRLRTLSWELERLAMEIGKLRDDAFPQNSSGPALDLHAGARGLARRPALPARGTLLFSRSTPAGSVTIPAGLLCCTADGSLRFETTQAGSIPAGENSVQIPAAATEPGERGNVAAGVIKVLLGAAPGVGAVTNPQSFIGGREKESDKELRARLSASLAEPPNAANEAFYRETASDFPGVLTAKVLPRNRGAGTVDVVIAAEPDYDEEEVIGALQIRLDARREIATDVMVYAAAPVTEDIVALVQVARGYLSDQVTASCKAALRTYMATLEIGQPLLLARLCACLLAVDGVENLRFLSPQADKKPGPGQRIAAGAVDVERMAL